jgi:hypothetical protein
LIELWLLFVLIVVGVVLSVQVTRASQATKETRDTLRQLEAVVVELETVSPSEAEFNARVEDALVRTELNRQLLCHLYVIHVGTPPAELCAPME